MSDRTGRGGAGFLLLVGGAHLPRCAALELVCSVWVLSVSELIWAKFARLSWWVLRRLVPAL
eukprot:5930125-Alexandrium_andersonii.AAC.1